tara:strand:- start:886 stop:1149 length:264 start_codon:yes stop_codon:yes gene_type:complete
MPRYAITSNLKAFPDSVLTEVSALIGAFICSEGDDEKLLTAGELTINYNPETKNVFISDSDFNIWYLSRCGYKLILNTGGTENDTKK